MIHFQFLCSQLIALFRNDVTPRVKISENFEENEKQDSSVDSL